MRFFILLAAVLGGIYWTANWSFHQLDNAVLISNYWESTTTSTDGTFQLLKISNSKPVIYNFSSTQGYWEIFKGLWPVWSLFILSFFILIPLSIYIFNSMNNAQITAAKEAQIDAEERAKKAESDAKKYEQKAKSWAEERVNSAYQEQLARVKKELSAEWDSFHKQKNQVVERESSIQNRERAAQQKENLSKDRVNQVLMEYHQELERFKTEKLEMARARDNAQAGYKRIKMKLEKQKAH